MNKYIIYILLILTASCETPVTPDLPDDNEQVVVYSFFRPGQRMRFDVFRTSSILESPVPQRLRGLVIELYQNGQLIESIPDENFESYISSTLAQSGQTYHFRIETVYGVVMGETFVPNPVQIESATFSTEVIDINLGEFGYPASVTFTDPGDELNYYALEVFVDQCDEGCQGTEISGELNELLIEDVKVNTSGNTDITISSGPDGIDGLRYIYFSDNGLNGDQFTLDFYIIPTLIDPDNLENVKIQYILKSITEDYYDYLISSDYQKQIEEEGVLTEPVQVFTNIQNGLGVFSGYSISMTQPSDIE